jgi:methyl-accepting chemotaxis protein
MKFRRDAPRILIGSVVLVVAALSFFSNRLFSGLTGAVEDKQFHLIETILASNLQAAQDKALARAEMLARMPDIQASLAARDRAKLLADCAPMFAVQQEKYGVDQVQFHIPPAISFLRLHAPEKFGDDLSTFRPMVASVNQDHVTRKGLVIASSGPAVFGVAPIQDPSGGSYVGSVDVGLDFGAILDALKASYQLDLALFIEEDPLQKFSPALAASTASQDNRRGKLLKLHSTQWDLMKTLVGDADLKTAETRFYIRETFGSTYGVVILPLRNPAGEPLGVLAAAQDFSASRAASGRSVILQILLAVFAIVLLAGAILIVLRGYVSRPLQMLNERFASLVDGEPVPVDTSEPWCEEVRDLAETYEKLRERGTKEPP